VNCSVGTCLTDGNCGCSYAVQDCHDTDACTQDFCDPGTGECFHPLLDCPPIGTEPNQCIEYSCVSEDEEHPCVATPRNGQRCEIDTNECLYGVCVTGPNSTWCNENPFDPIPLPPPPSQCCYYTCDPDMGIFPLCNTSSPCNTDDQCYNFECMFNANTSQCSCGIVSVKPHPGDDICTTYVCDPEVGWIPDYADGFPCGSPSDSTCDRPDTCMTGVCQPNYSPSSTPCAGETLCKEAANCTGTGLCAAQLNKQDSLSCGPSTGVCDPGNVCSSGSCVNNFASNGTICGPAHECHSLDICNGLGACVHGPSLPDGTSCGVAEICGSRNCSSGVCVNILLVGNICNASEFDCQLDAVCTGSNFYCPDRFAASESTLCRTGTGCFSDAYCDGQNFTCPEIPPINCDDSNLCTLDSCVRNATSGKACCAYQNLTCTDTTLCVEYTCDPLLGCQGSSVACNDNNTCTVSSCVNGSGCQFTPRPSDTQCDDGDECTVDDVCGPAANCSGVPLCSPKQCASVVCSAGDCIYSPANQTQNCTPTTAQTCPGGLTPCLAGYTCQGVSCLPLYHPASTLCRAAVDECDLPDYCSGSSACCPLDIKATAGTPCGSGTHVCGAEQCIAGLCQQVDLNTGQICNASSNPCELDAVCLADQFDCPPKETAVPCCLESEECDSLEACEDNLCVIQPQGCELSGCFDNVECMMPSCNNASKKCEYVLDDALCQEEDFCMTYSCSPVFQCLSGVNVGQLCNSSENCSRPEWMYTYWDCSMNSIEYPSFTFCQSVCVFGICTQHDILIAAINGSCGTAFQSGCLAVPIPGCCHEDLDCFDENSTDCSRQRCSNNTCEAYNATAPECCAVDSDCGEASGCDYYTCSDNACELTSIPCPTTLLPPSAPPTSSPPPTDTTDTTATPIPALPSAGPGEALMFVAPLLCCFFGLIFLRRRHHHHHHNHRHRDDRVQSRVPTRY
jgi:hypothetical protein